jgi:phosphatidylglycerophosphate synthase
VPWAIVALIVARELLVIPLATIYRFVVHGRGKHAFQAGVVGKAATIAEFLAIVAIIVHSPALVPLAIAAAALGLIAVGLYIVRATHAQAGLAT